MSTDLQKEEAQAGRLLNKVALITGASRGIGAAVAERFAQEGADLIVLARTTADLERLDDRLAIYGREVVLVPADLRHFEALDELPQHIYNRFGRLDILVGNAAVLGTLSPMPHVTPKIWSEVLDINLTANWRLLRACEPLLRQAPHGRALFVTSGVTQSIHPYWGPYAVSKTALETMVKTYAAEVANTNLRVNLIDPGAVATGMRAKAMPGEDPNTLPKPEDITEVFVRAASEECSDHGMILKA
ncbi:MAG: SDR family NAD(P)-dependent oxidoreductase [Holosporales bacterium]